MATDSDADCAVGEWLFTESKLTGGTIIRRTVSITGCMTARPDVVVVVVSISAAAAAAAAAAVVIVVALSIVQPTTAAKAVTRNLFVKGVFCRSFPQFSSSSFLLPSLPLPFPALNWPLISNVR